MGLTLLLALAAASGWWYLQRSLPLVDGELRAPGLDAPVHVVRDADGRTAPLRRE